MVEPIAEFNYSIDLIFNTMGIPFKKVEDLSRINPKTVPVILTYGSCVPDKSAKIFLKKGGCIINIPNYKEIKKSKNTLEEKGYRYNTFEPSGNIGYLESNNTYGIPVFYPFFCIESTSRTDVYLKFTSPDEFKNYGCLDYQEIGGGLYLGLGVDIISSIFYILTCSHERDKNERDQFRRFNELNNILLINNKHETPWINLYVLVLENLIRFCFEKKGIPLLQKWYWPENRKFAVWFSHDIDEVNKYTMKKSAASLMNRKIGHAFSDFRKSLSKFDRDPYWTFNRIMNLEKRYGYFSTFFFGSLTSTIKKQRIDKKEYRGLEIAYNIDSKHIGDLIKSIHDMGFEIGLHGSYGSSNNKDSLQTEKELLERYTDVRPLGIRQHYLRWEYPGTWQVQDSCGFHYDSTLGFSNSTGFRSGFCFPYNLYDPDKGNTLNIIELPLIVMDKGLISQGTEEFTEDAEERLDQIMDTVKNCHGLLSVLWHNTSFDESSSRAGTELYEKTLNLVKKRNAYVDLGRNISEWWHARNGIVISGFSYDKNSCEWTIKASKSISKITLKLHVPKAFIDKHKIFLKPSCRIISKDTEKGENIGIITLTIDKVEEDRQYKLNLVKIVKEENI